MSARLRAGLIDAVVVTLGSVAVAAGLVMFTVPNNIAPGGVSGMATALAHITPLRVGLWTLILNVPLILLGWWQLGLKPLIKTVASTLILSLGIDALTPLLPHYMNNPLLAAVLGGVLTGAGMGALFVRGASTGGTDLIGLMLHKFFPNVSVGTLLLLVDAGVVLFAMAVFQDIEVALYSIVTIFVTSRTIDSIMQGVDHARVVYVVSEKGEQITRALALEAGLGLTVLDGAGGYTNRAKKVMMLVLRRGNYARTLAMLRRIDPDVFLFVVNAAEVYGEGFKSV